MTEKEQKQREKDRKANRLILWRTIALMTVFGVLVFVPLLWKLWDIQVNKHDMYEEMAINNATRNYTVSADRGGIYDANGNPLAMSASVENVILSPNDIVELQAEYAEKVEKAKEGKGKYPDYPEPTNEFIASNLSAILGVTEEKVLEHLSHTKSQYREVKIKIEKDLGDQVREFIDENHITKGLYLLPDTKRYYPKSSLASHIIGFVNRDNVGAYGIEAKYNDELSGEAGYLLTGKNGKGTEMLTRYENYIKARNGYDLHLTVDSSIQAMLESALVEGIEKYDVRYGGFAIAMDPQTGAVLGMASSPDYDLNNYSLIADLNTAAEVEQLKLTDAEEAYQTALQQAAALYEKEEGPALTAAEEQALTRLTEKENLYLKALGQAQLNQWRSKALNDTYEPGSTFKAMVVAAALEEGVVNANSTFVCNGSYTVADSTIKCHAWKKGGHGVQTLAEAVENSCNPAFIQIGLKLGAETFYDYLEAYGMTDATGIDIPGEGSNAGLVWSREFFTGSYGVTSLATASFGQRFNVTPLQLITGISSVINGGHLLEPYVVESVVDSEGEDIYRHKTTEVRQVISEATSEHVRMILEGVVDGGTGKNAYEAGYRIGGKTGTSETLEEGRNIVSFVGFAPANDPKVVVLLAYDGPTRSAGDPDRTDDGVYISGGNMAAPEAGRVIANILDYMGVAKQYSPEELSGADTTVPRVTQHYLDYAESVLKQNNLTYRVVGEGDVITGQIPAAGATIPGGSQVVLYMGEEEVPTEQVEVPDLEGMSPEAAKAALTELGLYLRATGAVEYYVSTNVGTDQSIEAGTLVNLGTVVEVRFVDESIAEYTGD